MANVGEWAPNSSTNQRARLWIDATVPTPTAGQTSITVTTTVDVEAWYSFSDSSNSLSRGGSLFGSGSWTNLPINVPTKGTQTIHTSSGSVALSTSEQVLPVTYTLTGIDYIGASVPVTATMYVTIPSMVLEPPNPPTAVTASRSSDTQHSIGWTHGGTAGAKDLESFQVARRGWSQGVDYVTVASGLANVARSWTDTSTAANDRWTWRVRAVGRTGLASAWVSASPTCSTTPSAASSVTVGRSGADALVTWVVNAPLADAQKLQSQSSTDNGATWSALADVSGHTGLGPAVTSRTITGLAADRLWRFRVVTSVATPAALSATSAASNNLVLLAKPNPPTWLAPTVAPNTANGCVFRWRHNAVDGSAQTAYELQYRIGTGAYTTLSGTTADNRAATLATGSYNGQVRTKGSHADWSDWSASASFDVKAPPTASIVSPTTGSVLPSDTLTLTAGYYDPAGAPWVSWSAELWQSGALVETITGTGTTPTRAFGTRLANGSAPQVRLTVLSGSGLPSAQVAASYTVTYAPPPTPTLLAQWIEDAGAVSLVVTNPAGTPAAISTTIERSIDAGTTWQAVASAIPLNSGASDRRVPLGILARYRAVAVSATGSTAISAVQTVDTSTSRLWIETAGGSMLWLAGALSLDVDDDHDRELVLYMGERSPRSYYGAGRPRRVAVKGRTVAGLGLGQDWTSALGGDVYYRDPVGRAMWASLSAVSTGQQWAGLSDVTFTASEVLRG